MVKSQEASLQSCLSRETLESPIQLTLQWSTPNVRTGRCTLDLSLLCSFGDLPGQLEDSSQLISRQSLSRRLNMPSSSPWHLPSSRSEKGLSKSIESRCQDSSYLGFSTQHPFKTSSSSSSK